MPDYIEREYEDIEKFLEPFAEEHELDMVTLGSLIRGSIEILEPTLPKATVTVIETENFSKATSWKINNIKFNLKSAFNSIFLFKTIPAKNDIWLIMAIFRIILSVFDTLRVELNQQEAIVLFCVYRLRNATCEEINLYVEKLKVEGKKVELSKEEIKESLEKLEKIGTILLQNGKYSLVETVLLGK